MLGSRVPGATCCAPLTLSFPGGGFHGGQGMPSWLRIALPTSVEAFQYFDNLWLSWRALPRSKHPALSSEDVLKVSLRDFSCQWAYVLGGGWARELSPRAELGVLHKRLRTLWLKKAMSGRSGHSLSSLREAWAPVSVPWELPAACSSPGERPPLPSRFSFSVLSSFSLAYFHH